MRLTLSLALGTAGVLKLVFVPRDPVAAGALESVAPYVVATALELLLAVGLLIGGTAQWAALRAVVGFLGAGAMSLVVLDPSSSCRCVGIVSMPRSVALVTTGLIVVLGTPVSHFESITAAARRVWIRPAGRTVWDASAVSVLALPTDGTLRVMVAPGDHRLSAGCFGFADATLDRVSVTSGVSSDLDISLGPESAR